MSHRYDSCDLSWWTLLARLAPMVGLTLALVGCPEDTSHAGDDDDSADHGDDDDTAGDPDDPGSWAGDDDDTVDDDYSWEQGGCYEITDADVQDDCFADDAQLPAAALTAINGLLIAAGADTVSNPVDVSAAIEDGLEQLLLATPPFSAYPVDPDDLVETSVEIEVPNPLDYTTDGNGNITGYGTMTLACAVEGDELWCDAEDFYFNATAVIVSMLVGYPVVVEEYECWVTAGAVARMDHAQGPQTVVWDAGYTLEVDQANCNDLIEMLFDDPSQACGTDAEVTADRVGNIPQNGSC